MNKVMGAVCLVLLSVSVMTPPPVVAEDAVEKLTDVKRGQQPDQTTSSGQDVSLDKAAAPLYVPPSRGAPLVRVDAGVRGAEGDQPYVAVVTPEHTGYSSTSQPVLYWYASGSMKTRFEFALVNNQEIEPIVEVVSDETVKRGFHSVKLAEHGISLAPEVSYQWSVALVPDPEKRSSDIVSSGRIEYRPMTEAQTVAMENAGPGEKIGIFARTGYWYDTFSAVSGLIENAPNDKVLRRQRAALLEQIGMAREVNLQ